MELTCLPWGDVGGMPGIRYQWLTDYTDGCPDPAGKVAKGRAVRYGNALFFSRTHHAHARHTLAADNLTQAHRWCLRASPSRRKPLLFVRVAQWIEQKFPKLLVGGSIPLPDTILLAPRS